MLNWAAALRVSMHFLGSKPDRFLINSQWHSVQQEANTINVSDASTSETETDWVPSDRATVPSVRRSSRVRRMPKRFDEYSMSA